MIKDSNRKIHIGTGILALFLVIAWVLQACAPQPAIPAANTAPVPANTQTAAPSPLVSDVPTITATLTSTPTITPAPSPTSTVEATNFKACPDIEKFRECKVTFDQLFDGSFLKFLRTLSKPFDSSKFKNPMPPMVTENFGINVIMYQRTPNGVANFPKPEEAPFRKNEMSYLVVLPDGREALGLALEYADEKEPNNPDKNHWVLGYVLLYYQKGKYGAGDIEGLIKIWKEDMNIAPLITTPGSDYGLDDPIGIQTLALHPDMPQRFVDFEAGKIEVLEGIPVRIDILEFEKNSPFK